MTAAVVDEYQSQTEALATSTVAAVLGLYATLQAGELAPATVTPAIAAVIATANAAATTLADLSVAAQIEVAAGVPTPPTGIAPRDDTDRLTVAVETIMSSSSISATSSTTSVDEPDEIDEPQPDDEPDDDEIDEPEPDEIDEPTPVDAQPDTVDEPAEKPQRDSLAVRLERLARSEPLAAAQAVSAEIVAAAPSVEGWRRVLDADPCGRCVRWAEDGRVFPADHHFKSHYGCNCQLEVVVIEGKTA